MPQRNPSKVTEIDTLSTEIDQMKSNQAAQIDNMIGMFASSSSAQGTVRDKHQNSRRNS